MLGGGAVAEDGGVAAAGAGGGGLALELGVGAGLTDEFVEGGGGGLEEFPVDTAVSPTLYTGL